MVIHLPKNLLNILLPTVGIIMGILIIFSSIYKIKKSNKPKTNPQILSLRQDTLVPTTAQTSISDGQSTIIAIPHIPTSEPPFYQLILSKNSAFTYYNPHLQTYQTN